MRSWHRLSSQQHVSWRGIGGIVVLLITSVLASCSYGTPVVVFPTGTAGAASTGIPGGTSTGGSTTGGTTVQPASETAKLKWQPITISDNILNGLSLTESGGILYINTNSELLAVNAQDGKTTVWHYLPSFGSPEQMIPVVDNGVVYDLIFGQGLVALNGKRLWDTDSTTSTHLDIANTEPTVGDGNVYVHAVDNQQEYLDAFAAQSGALVWQHAFGATTTSTNILSPAISAGVIYVVANDGKLYALNTKTGSVLWSYSTGVQNSTNTTYSSPIVSQGIVVFGAYQSGALADQAGGVFALNAATGAFAWKQSLSLSFGEGISVSGNTLLISSNGQLGVYNLTTGAQQWSLQNVNLTPYVMGGNTIYGIYNVPFSGASQMVAYTLAGKGLWQFTPPLTSAGLTLTTNLVYDQGALYLGYYNNTSQNWAIYGFDISSYPTA